MSLSARHCLVIVNLIFLFHVTFFFCFGEAALQTGSQRFASAQRLALSKKKVTKEENCALAPPLCQGCRPEPRFLLIGGLDEKGRMPQKINPSPTSFSS